MRRIKDKGEFERLWKESRTLICDFSASWCGPCKMLEPVLKKLEKEHPDIVFAKVDIDENEGLSDAHKIQAVPTILFVKKGKVLRRITGLVSYQELSGHAKKLLAKGGP